MKILKVFGDDYAALQFDNCFKVKHIITDMENENVTEKELETEDGEVIYVELVELNTLEEVFEYCKKHMLDYDDSKHTNYYRKVENN